MYNTVRQQQEFFIIIKIVHESTHTKIEIKKEE